MLRRLSLTAVIAGAAMVPLFAQDSALVQKGQELYASHRCARCHRIAGKGYREGKLDGIASKMSADDMRKWLTTPADMEATLDTKPKVRMSSRKTLKLSEGDVTALVAYLRTLK